MADALSSALNVGPVDRAVRAPTSKPTPEPKMDQESVLQKQIDEGRTKAADLIGQMSEFNAVEKAHAAEQKGKEAETQARLIREEKDKITGSDTYKQLQDTELSIAREQFHPTERSIGENLALAAATTIMGHMIGKGGKVPATITLAGMNGMMEGIRAGDLNRYKEQKQKFEDGLNNLVRKGQVLSKGLERIIKLAAIDKEEAYYEAQALFAKENADFMRQYADKYGIPKLYELNQANLKKAEELLAKYQLKDKERQDRAAQARLQAGLREPKVVGTTAEGYGVYLMPDGTEKVGTTKLTLGKRGGVGATGGLSAVIREATGVDLPPKDAAVVQSNVQGIRTIESLQTELRDPEVTKGLQAKAASFFEKLNSLSDSADFATGVNTELTGTDKTTLFLKKALLSAYAIERAATDGQRVTVQMMKQAGPVLDPTNYTAPAFNQLLDDRRQDLYSKLHDYGLRPEQIKSLSAKVPYEPYIPGSPTQPASPTKPSESDGWSVKEK